MAREDVVLALDTHDPDWRAQFWPRDFAGLGQLPGVLTPGTAPAGALSSALQWLSSDDTPAQDANLAAVRAGAGTLPYPGAGLPSDATAQDAIVYGSANPSTGVINWPQAQYFIKGGAPPASVLAADPQAATIPSLATIQNVAGAAEPRRPHSLSTWLLIGGGLALVLLLTR